MNQLKSQTSPYLLQHVDNPVDWYSWCEKAFEKAKREDKPVFLSIGYSTCHWCHVMAHESFEDNEVAELLNEHFVSIKVDREERPDLDGVYMTVAQMMTGSGGWPLTIIMTPDKKPFFAGTYFPKQARFGRIGMLELVPRIADVWRYRREDIYKSADSIVGALQSMSQGSSAEDLNPSVFKKAFDSFSGRFDAEFGGFGTAPKFPSPHNLTFLLRNAKQTNCPKSLQMVEETLSSIHLGGVFDQVGFGFHRYSTDREWLLPHFEKMLYDQALLAIAYTETYQVTKKAKYKKVAEQIFSYVLRDMTSPEGAFYSAEDADSEGEEGKFYVWSIAELKEVLGEEEGQFVADLFNCEEDGNFLDEATKEYSGTNILHLKYPLATIAQDLGCTEEALERRWEAARGKLFEHRKKRIHPLKDDKILTDWNALMIVAFARASVTFENSEYRDVAQKAMEFLQDQMVDPKGHLYHSGRSGIYNKDAYLDDYSFVIWALLELYCATSESKHLKSALNFLEKTSELFLDEQSGGYFFTAADNTDVISRQKEIYDGALPSGNSVMLCNLFALAEFTGNTQYLNQANSLIKAFSGDVSRVPSAHTQLLNGLNLALYGSSLVVLTEGEGLEAMLDALRSEFLPNTFVVLRKENDLNLFEVNPSLNERVSLDGKATAYVCKNGTCQLPLTEPKKVLAELKNITKVAS